MIVCVFFVTPKINTFLSNKVGQYGIIEQKLTEIVDKDIETKVKRDYKIATGQELEDEVLLEQLKAQAYKIDPEKCDELNMVLNCGLPQGVVNTILLNFSDTGAASIQATTFPQYAAKFFIVKMTSLISLIIAFSIAGKIFVSESDCYRAGYEY